MKKVEKLNEKEIYLLTTLIGLGFKFKLLKKNRNTLKSNITKKKESINNLNGCTTPIIVCTADACNSEGLEIVDPKTGKDITSKDPDWKKILVVIEGAHRLLAYLEIVEEMEKEGKSSVLYPQVYCILPLLDKPIKEQLHHSNSEVLVWKGLDFATSLLLENHKDFDSERLEFVKELIGKGVRNDAAYILAQLNKDPIPTKSQLIKANANTPQGANIRESLSKKANLKDAKEIFKQLNNYLGIAVIKYRDVAYKIVDIYQTVKGNKAKSITNFLKKLDKSQITNFTNAKNGKKAAELLGEAFSKYNTKS